MLEEAALELDDAPPSLSNVLTLFISKTISALGVSVKLIAATKIVIWALAVLVKSLTGSLTIQESPLAWAFTPLIENSFIIDIASFLVAKSTVASPFLTVTLADSVM